MNWYYAADGKQVGPVAEADFENLVKAGTVRPNTLVWREGMTDWKPYGEVVAPATPPPAGSVACAECGNIFPAEEVIQFGDVSVCAACKPIFMQKLKEGAAIGAGVGSSVSVDQVVAREFEINIGDCLSKSWELVKANFGSILGAVVVAFGLQIVVSFIPFGVGNLASLVLSGPLMGGLYLFYLKKMRGQDVAVGEVFSGFGPRFVNLMLAHIVTAILAGLCIVPAVVAIVVAVLGNAARHSGPPSTQFILLLLGPIGILFLLGVCGMVYLQTCWVFTIPLAADKRMGFWEAMKLSRRLVMKHWWMTFLFLFVAGIIGMCGLFACGVGLLFTGPVALGMKMYLYEKALGDLTPVSA